MIKGIHYVLAHIPSKNHDFSYYGLKSSLHMLVTQVVKWFFDLRHFRPIFDFLKKCSFADFSTFHKKSLVKIYVFHHSFQTCTWNQKSSLSILSSLHGAKSILHFIWFQVQVWQLWWKMWWKISENIFKINSGVGQTFFAIN